MKHINFYLIIMDGMKPPSKRSEEKRKALKGFLTHLAIFVVVNLVLLVVPVFYDGKVDFNFEDRKVLYYGSIGWGIGLAIHGVVVFVDRMMNRSEK